MGSPAVPHRRLRAGLFEIDLDTGEVYRSGHKVPLQEQPFRVLALLLEHPGEVITREQLQSQLWPADTYVSFDEGLNTAIRKLRIAFGDSAENPRFIETLPRRGYRFIAPVVARNAGSTTPAVPSAPASMPEAFRGPAGARFLRKPALLGGIAAATITAALATWLLLHAHPQPTTTPARRVMLVVLPFQNLSNDSSQEYFSDGLTEETITDLGQLSPEQLGVIARTSSMAYKHTNKTVGQIGRELKVDYVLEGSVRRDGDRARISAQLIRVSDQTHLWAQNFDRELNHLLDLQDELGNTIAQQVQVTLTPRRQLALAKTRRVDPAAYDLYLRGRFYWNQRTTAGMKESIGYFREAIAKDPKFALAYSGLADAYNISNIVGTFSAEESLPQARAAAEQAIALDPDLAEAHAALGMEKSHYEFDFPAAQREFLKAIELNPNSAYAHLFYSNCYLMPMGRVQEAIAENKRALELDPLSLPINNFLAMSYYFAGDYESAHRQFQHTLEMDPTFPLAHDYFAQLLAMMGRYEQAIEERQESALLRGASPAQAAAEAAQLSKAFRTGGATGYWQGYLRMVLEMQRTGRPLTASDLSWCYAMAGNKEKSFEWLNRAYNQREGEAITLLKVDPTWKNLHDDPRFSDWLRKLGLPTQ